jgi:hypothetical protein
VRQDRPGCRSMLLDSGAIMQDEFNHEKAKILAQP